MKQKIKEQNNKQFASGITLISLVVTIIILIILAMVTINLIIGERGIFHMGGRAKIESEIAKYEEEIELARGDVELEHIGEVTLDNLINKIYENKIVEEGAITKLNEQIAKMVTKEGYIFTITADKTKYIGKGEKGEEIINKLPEEIKVGDISILLSNYEWTKDNITVSLENNIEQNYFILQYSFNQENWNNYEKPFEVEKNETVCVCLKNIKGEMSSVASYKISNIDKLIPNEPEIQVSSNTNSITIEVSASDQETTEEYGKSEIGEIWYSKDNGQTWQTNEEDKIKTSYTYEGLMPGTSYQIQVKVIDKAKNETIGIVEEPVQIKIPVTEITLNKASTLIEKGKTETLTITEILPENASNKNVKWTSSNTNIATVNNGVVTAKEIGSATITVTAQDGSGISAKCNVRVTKPISILKPGDYIQYDSGKNGKIQCRVLYDTSSAYGLQIIANQKVKAVTLGGNTSNSALESWKSAIGTLNKAAEKYLNTTYASGARSVGSTPSNWNAHAYTTSAIETYGTDVNAMDSVKGGFRRTGWHYWYASKTISSNGERWLYLEHEQGGVRFQYGIWSNANSFRTETHQLRPVFILKPDVKITGGSGTGSSPYTLGI